MQIIQSLLGTQVNTLGQKSYLGYHHQLLSQTESTSLHYRHSNFIKPLASSKSLFTPSRLFLSRKHQPFLDTLFTDGDNLACQDIDADLQVMDMETYNSITLENSTDESNNLKFNLSNISNILQTQIASNLSNEILPEINIQPKAKKNRKNQTHKSQKRKTSQSKSKPKKSAKSSTTKKVRRVIDETAISSPTAEEHLLITDNHQAEIFNLTDNYPAIQQPIILENTILNISEFTINSSNLEDNSNLPRQIAYDEPQLITDLPSNFTDIVNDFDIRESGKLSKQDSEFDSTISDLSEYSLVEPQSPDIEEQINILNNFTNHQPTIASETAQSGDILDITVSKNSLQKDAEYSNITQPNSVRDINNFSPVPIEIIPEENLLHRASNLNEIPDNSSDLVAKNHQVVTDANNSNLVEAKPLISKIISPKCEDTATSVTNLSNTHEQPLVSDVSSLEFQAESVNEITTSLTAKNTIVIPQEINIDNLTTESLVPENSELLSPSLLVNIQTNLFRKDEEKITASSTISPPDITSLSFPNNQEDTIAQPSAIQTEFASSEITTIQSEKTAPTTEDATTPEVTVITPITTSPRSPDIQENTTVEINHIQPEKTAPTTEDATTPDVTAITPVTTSPISPDIQKIATSELTNIQPDITSPTSPTADEVYTADSSIIPPETADISLPNSTDKLPIFRNIFENAQPTTSQSNLAFERLDLSTFVNNSDIPESTSSQDNGDNSFSIDIEPNTLLNNLPAPKGYATGGQVTTTAVENHQPVAPSDTVPAMLTPGEFVINAKDAQKNLHILKHINAGGSPEEMISPSLEVANTKTPEETNFSETTTKVDSFIDSTLQRKEAEPDSSSEATALTSPSLGVEIGKQRLSRLNSPQINTVENTTNTSRETSPHYSSPSLIFRKTNSTTNTQTPSQWSSLEELLNSSNDEFTNFNLSNVESNWQHSPSSQVASSSAPSHIFTSFRPQGFANGGEVIAPDISRDIAPITETIQSPYSSLATEENDDHEDDDAKLEALAQEIYYRLRQRIEIDKERQGKYVGRLPW